MLKMMKTNQTQRPVLKHGCLLFINIVILDWKGKSLDIIDHSEIFAVYLNSIICQSSMAIKSNKET